MKYVLILFLALSFSGCTVIQVVKLDTTNCKELNNQYYFSNDKVSITYSFWEMFGRISFTIHNKTDKPIYINWRNSSLIVNGNKLNYWDDYERTNSISLTLGYAQGTTGWFGRPAVVGTAVTTGQSTTYRPEKVTFIPPNSDFKKSWCIIMDTPYIFPNTIKSEKEPLSDHPTKLTKVKQQSFIEQTSFLSFRNYLAIALSEESSDFSFIDNNFYIASVREMKLRHFLGKRTNPLPYPPEHSKREKNNASFYVQVKQDAIK